jgi:hypothetical protein
MTTHTPGSKAAKAQRAAQLKRDMASHPGMTADQASLAAFRETCAKIVAFNRAFRARQEASK